MEKKLTKYFYKYGLWILRTIGFIYLFFFFEVQNQLNTYYEMFQYVIHFYIYLLVFNYI